MASILEEERKIYPKEPLDKTLLLNSLKSYQKDGVMLGVEKVIEPKLNTFGKVTINSVLRIVGAMPKCRMYELDEDGQYIQYEDEMTGETRRKIHIDDGEMQSIFFPFYANIKKGEEGLDDAEELPKDTGNVSIATNFAELKEALDGFYFLGKYELIKGKTRSFPSLKCELVEEDI